VVVDDVENDAEAERVRAIDERAQGRPAWPYASAPARTRGDAVVSPAERPGKSAIGIISMTGDAMRASSAS
jgi:hypothetical protein